MSHSFRTYDTSRCDCARQHPGGSLLPISRDGAGEMPPAPPLRGSVHLIRVLSRGFSFSFLYIKKVGRKRFIVARTRDCAATRADESLYARKEADAQRSAILVCSDANWSSSSAILLSFALAVSSNVHLTFCVFVSSGIVGIGVSILLFFRQYFSWFLIRIEGLMLG